MAHTCVFALPGSEPKRIDCARHSAPNSRRGRLRSFPDQESYLRVDPCKPATWSCTLDHPNAKLLPLYFLATAALEQGARSVGLVAPYLAYMRQDTVQKGRGDYVDTLRTAGIPPAMAPSRPSGIGPRRVRRC